MRDATKTAFVWLQDIVSYNVIVFEMIIFNLTWCSNFCFLNVSRFWTSEKWL